MKNGFWKIEKRECVSSTNTVLKNMAKAGAPTGSVLIARTQSAGRGRLGRSFYSPVGGVYLSLLLRPDFNMDEVLLITPAVAVAAAKACEKISGQPIQIKWVNDLLLDGKKICGILCESILRPDGANDGIIVGVGVNLTPPPGGFPPDIIQHAGALNTPGQEEAFCTAFLSFMEEILQDFQSHSFLAQYRARCPMIGQRVTLRYGDEIVSGIVQEIDNHAALVLRTAHGCVKSFSAGEVTSRLP